MTADPHDDADRTDGTERSAREGPVDLSRRTYCKTLAATAIAAAATGSAGAAPPGGDHEAVMDLVPTSSATHTATSSGRWDDGAVWAGGVPPGDGARVHVESGVTVTVDHLDAARLAWIRVDGTLAFDPATDTRLRVDTLVTTEGSRLEVGTRAAPIQSDATAEIEFVDRGPIDEGWDPTRVSRGLLPMGDVELVGAETTAHTTLATPPTPGDGSLELESTPTNWSAGDALVVPGVSPRENQDEEVTIASVSGTTVSLVESIQYDHSPPAPDLDTYALNLDRNVRLSSESTDVDRRGHVMVMSRGSTIEYAGLYELGRTDKSTPFSDPLYKESEIRNDGVFDLAINDNRKARYPLHYHKTGAFRDVEPHRATGCVVAPRTDGSGWKGSPGWGFTNHQSYAHVQDCVSYRVFGTHFMTETGNEIGTFHGNFALRSEGSGDDPDWREVVAWADHANRPLIDDYGHGGHGFWLHGPLVSVENNVAAGHRNFAFAYWTRSLGDYVPDDVDDPAVPPSELDREIVEADIGRHRGEIPQTPASYADGKPSPEHNVAPGSPGPNVAEFAHATFDAGGTTYVDPGSIPIRNVDNVAFASGAGVDVMNHMRGVEGTRDTVHGNDDYYGIVRNFTAFNIGNRTGESDLPYFEMRQNGEVNFEFPRGVNIGISMRYANHLKVENPRLIGMGDGAGIVHNMRARGLTVEDATIENWADGIGALTDGIAEIRNPTFANVANSEINIRGEQILGGQPTTHLEGVDAGDEIYLDATADVSSGWEWAITLDGGDVYYDEVAPPEAEDDPRLTGGQIVGGDGGGGEPSAPANLSSPAQTTSSVDLDWDHDGSNTAYYNVYVDGQWDSTADGTSHTVTGLDPGTSYGFHVTADDGNGTQSPDSNAITVATDADGGGGQQPYPGSPHPVPGRIQAQEYDTGGEGVAYHDTTDTNQGGAFRTDETVDVEAVSDSTGGSYNVGWTADGEWLEYTVDVAEAGAYDVHVRNASGGGGGTVSVDVGGTDVTGAVGLSGTGGWQSWQTSTIQGVSLDAGEQIVRVNVDTGGFNLNWIEFEAVDTGDGGGGDQQPYDGTPVTIPGRVQAQEYDTGGESVAYHDTTDTNQGGAFRTDENVDVEDATEGDYNVCWVADGEWIEYTVDVQTTGTYDLHVRTASDLGGGTMRFLFDDQDVTGVVDTPATGGWQSWQTVTVSDVGLDAGEQVMRVEFEADDFNHTWFELELVDDGGGSGGGGGGDYSGSAGDGWSASVASVGSDQDEWTFEPNSAASWVDVHFAEPGTDAWVGYRMDGSGTEHTHTRDTSGDGGSIDVRFLWDDGNGGQYVSERRTHQY